MRRESLFEPQAATDESVLVWDDPSKRDSTSLVAHLGASFGNIQGQTRC